MTTFLKYILSLILVITTKAFAQTPLDDPHWVKNTSLSDDFNGTALDTTLWKPLNCCVLKDQGYNWGGHTAFDANMVSVSSGTLNLKVDGTTHSFGYRTGGIWSKNTPIDQDINAPDYLYSYGYFETYSKLPGNFNGTGDPVGSKFFPAFWTYYIEVVSGCRTVHNEMDILEPDGSPSQYGNAKTNVCGFHYENGACSQDKIYEGWYTHSSPLFSDYHKYAVEWGSNRMIFYFDDKPFYALYNDSRFVKEGNQAVVIDQQLSSSYNFDPSTTFPQYMKVDYFYYYTLTKDCSNNAFIYNNTDLGNYVFSVKSSITFGHSNGTDVISLGNTDRKYFRAVNDVTINGDFTVPLGAEFSVLPTPCDN